MLMPDSDTIGVVWNVAESATTASQLIFLTFTHKHRHRFVEDEVESNAAQD